MLQCKAVVHTQCRLVSQFFMLMIVIGMMNLVKTVIINLDALEEASGFHYLQM